MKNSFNSSNEIRSKFLDFFKKNSHKEIKSSSLIPIDDPTILFTNSGMVQFKKWFTGQEKPSCKNVVSSQKCIRAGGKHNDLENVGYTPRHHTFFEMLGNFSFGGYFKEEAIKLAWDLLTKEYSLDVKRLIITVFEEDEVSYKIWKKISGFTDQKIIKISSNDNFWSMGDSGPCGPCSEIFFDNGSHLKGGLPGSKDQEGERYIEIWNLVFMEFEKRNDLLKKLPGKFVDTGMGLERITAVLSNKINNYETDLFQHIFEKIEKKTEKKINPNTLISFRIISDHIKSIIFMMSDGILPSNEGRGYVLRRIIRRALLHVNKLKPQSIILNELVDDVIERYSDIYYELTKANLFIKKNLKTEEEKFTETLSTGLQLLNKEIKKLKDEKFPASLAFKLYDTYGFPIDMTASILNDKKIKLNLDDYKKLVKSSKNLQKQSWVGSDERKINHLDVKLENSIKETKFCGYEMSSCKAILKSIIHNNKSKESVGIEDNDAILIFDKTPFYAEAGGQVGDSGKLYDLKNNLVCKVFDTKKIEGGVYLHFVKEFSSNIEVKKEFLLEIDISRREKIRNNHSATHLLHESLRQIVGKHVSQKGSLVNEKKLRFDYSSNSQITSDEVKKIEILVNNSIRSNMRINIKKMPVRKAIESGAIALFGEKYPENVRVVSMLNQKNSKDSKCLSSIELCGGTHVDSTGQIGLFKIIGDTSISSGVRRVEAVTGEIAEDFFDNKLKVFQEVKTILKASDENILEKIESLKKGLLESKKRSISDIVTFSRNKMTKSQGLNVYFDNLDCTSKELKNSSDEIKKKLDSGIIVLTAKENQKVSVVVSITDDLLEKFDANNIIKNIIIFLGGRGGGGRKDLAQGGAPFNKKYEDIKRNIEKLITTIY
ncbi:MAG: alanine--tRNA ligase [Pseudomonadota bacterium]|nr:alanine--tRNA ligase [Pseudomonadota bacterium]